jgi:hypothetical protein
VAGSQAGLKRIGGLVLPVLFAVGVAPGFAESGE